MCVVDLVPSSCPGTQTKLHGVLALYVFTQYEADFMQESLEQSRPCTYLLATGLQFLGRTGENAHMHTDRNLDILHHFYDYIRMMAA